MSSWANQMSNPDRVVPHTRIEDETALDRKYAIGVKLGAGSFGVVKVATHLETGEKWAIKIVNKEKAGSSAVVLLEREVAILKKVNHPNIIHLEEVFETSKKVYLLMEYCSQGELSTLYKRKGTFSEEDAKVVIKRLAKAVSYLHKNDIVHRDIKLENILLSVNPSNPEDKLHIKLTDFGLSVVKGGVGSDSMIQSMCGTPMYMAPEVIDNQGYSQQCDVWSIGVITYTLMGGSPPFSGKDEDQLYENIRKGELDFTGKAWKNVSTEGKNAVMGLLKVDPAHRLTVHELLDHPWITGDHSRGLNKGPSNVLEMMKQWKEELLLENDGSKVDGSTVDGSTVDGSTVDGSTADRSKVDGNANEIEEQVSRGQPAAVDTGQPTVKTSIPKVINTRVKVSSSVVSSSQSTIVHSSFNKINKNSMQVQKSNTSRSPVRRLSPTTHNSSPRGKLSAPNSGRHSPTKPCHQLVRPHSTTATSSTGTKTSSLKSAPGAHARSPPTTGRQASTRSTSTVTASEIRRKKKSGNGS